jgi:YD repeat-containing protein
MAPGCPGPTIDPLNRRTTLDYDKAGRQTLRIDGKNRRTTYVYDDAGQQTSASIRMGRG